MAREPTLFMRIHKTAGEALAKQLCDHLLEEEVCPEKFEWKLRDLPPGEVRRFSFFQGHITPSALSDIFATLRVFTILREPGERLLSCFFYWKENARHGKGEFFETIAPMTLAEFLRSDNPVIRRATWNVQARLLAGGQFGAVDQQRQAVFGPWLSELDLAAEAVRALDRFAFVGVMEEYEASLRAAFALMELGPPPPPERINVTPARPVSYRELLAAPAIADALSRLTGVDRVVYEAARRKLGRVVPDLKSARP